MRIAIGPGGATPFRATAAEAILRGKPFDSDTFARMLDALHEQAQFRTSPRRASADYRRHIVEGLLWDVL